MLTQQMTWNISVVINVLIKETTRLNLHICLKSVLGAGEMAQWLKALAFYRGPDFNS